MLRALSGLSLAAIAVGIAGLYFSNALFASHWALRTFQGAAFIFMVAARITFGRRRDQAPDHPTAGALITTGPYAYLRHPIYAAIIHFVWAGATDHFSWPVLGWAETVTAGAFTRMHIEEHQLIRKYPEYRAYKKRVKKLIPFVY